MKQIILPLLSVFTIAMADGNSGNGTSDIFQCGDEDFFNYASYDPMPMIGTPEVLYEADCHYVKGKAYISFYTNVPRQLLRDYFQIGYVSTCPNNKKAFYSCNMSTGKPEGCDAVPSGLSFVVNQSLHLEKYETNDFFNKIINGSNPGDFEIVLPRNVSEAKILEIGNDAVKLMGNFLYIYYGNDFVFGGDDDVVDFGESLSSALAVCKSAGEYYEKNSTLVGFKMSSSSSVASSSSVVESSSAVMPKSSAVESSSSVAKSSSSSVKSSSSVGTVCSAHPMRRAPSQPKSACITKNNKCYKCNGARSASECSADWIWTSPRSDFDRYWYSEVDCETGAVVEKKGAGVCFAYPMNNVPSDPKSTCVSKGNKCYKCNGARSSSECSSEWLWTSQNSNFDSYWFSEVDCETGAPLMEKKFGKCFAHPMGSIPSDPKSACVSKGNKCYKCNGARSSAECSAEWLWTSPREHFDSYWYSEVSCETARPVLAKSGAVDQNVPGIANGGLKNAGYAVDFSTDKRYFDALGRSAKIMPLKRRPLYVEKPSVKSVEAQIPATED